MRVAFRDVNDIILAVFPAFYLFTVKKVPATIHPCGLVFFIESVVGIGGRPCCIQQFFLCACERLVIILRDEVVAIVGIRIADSYP